MTRPATRPPVVIRARGHERITATHGKTFELSTDHSIGGEATCVIGVAAEADWDALGGVIGPVAIVIEAGGSRQTLNAEASPFWTRGHGLVVRRSDYRSDDTLAVHADAAAADLDRALVEALAAPAAEVVVTVRPLGPPPAVALFTDRLEPRVANGVRVYGVPVGDVALDDVDVVLARPGAAIAAAQAVAGVPGDVLVLGPLPRGKRVRSDALATARQEANAVALVTVGEVPDDVAATAVFRPGEVVAPVRVGRPEQRVNADDRVFSVWAGLGGRPGADGPVGPLLQALLAEGVSARSLRQAVSRVPGLDKAWDYDAINALHDR